MRQVSSSRVNLIRCLPALAVFLLFVWLYSQRLHPALRASLGSWADIAIVPAAFLGLFAYGLTLMITAGTGQAPAEPAEPNEELGGMGGGDRMLKLFKGAGFIFLGGICLFLGFILWIKHASAWVAAPVAILGVVLFSIGSKIMDRAFTDEGPEAEKTAS